MSDKPLTCETCAHWQGTPNSHSAGCALLVYTGLVPFNRSDPPCPSHSSTPQPGEAQVRATIVQMWQARP